MKPFSSPTRILTGIILLFALTGSPASGGELDAFRKASSKKPKTSKSSSSSSKDKKAARRESDDDGYERSRNRNREGLLGRALMAVIQAGVEGGAASNRRYDAPMGSFEPSGEISTNSLSESLLDPDFFRSPGDVTIPVLRLDGNYHRTSDSLDAIDGRAELGYGSLAISYRHTQFTETLDDGGEDQLELSQALLLYRMSPDATFEFDIGLGAGSFGDAVQDYNLEFSVGFLYAYNEHLAAEWRGAWIQSDGHSVSDQDFAIMAGVKHVALRAGYRTIRSGPADLDGPHVGMMLTW